VLALRVAYTAIVLVVVVWLLRDGKPLGGLVIVPLLAIWLRQSAESGRLTQLARRVSGTS
jgi:hypothetical protein